MKKMIMILAVSMLGTSLPALAATHATIGHDENCIRDCQMLVKNCGQEVDSIQQRISKLDREISKGSAIYTAQELKILKRNLQEAEDTLTHLTIGA